MTDTRLGRRPRSRLTALMLLLTLPTGCLQWVPEDEYVDWASRLALAPGRTCDELKRFAGATNLPTVEHPGQLGLEYSEHTVVAPGGNRLGLWYLPAEADRGVVIFSTGAAAGMACYLLIPSQLVAAGWSVVIYDYEGFGESEGQATLTVLPDDLAAVLDWTLANAGHARVTLLGASVGTIPSVTLAAERPEVVNGVVLDGVISLRVEMERWPWSIPSRVEVNLAQLGPRLMLDEQIRDVTAPVLAIGYGRDEYATSRHLEEILAECPGPVSSYYFDDLGHARGPYRQPETYFALVTAFLDGLDAAD